MNLHLFSRNFSVQELTKEKESPETPKNTGRMSINATLDPLAKISLKHQA
jgi:hypothetical protein